MHFNYDFIEQFGLCLFNPHASLPSFTSQRGRRQSNVYDALVAEPASLVKESRINMTVFFSMIKYT